MGLTLFKVDHLSVQWPFDENGLQLDIILVINEKGMEVEHNY